MFEKIKTSLAYCCLRQISHTKSASIVTQSTSPNAPMTIIMPHDFPMRAYEAVHSPIAILKNSRRLSDQEYVEFAGSWNALAYRFRDAIEAAMFLEGSFAKHGEAPIPEERYRQDSALYEYYAAKLSAFDCAAYSLFALGSMLDNVQFPFTTDKERRKVTFEVTHKAFSEVFSNEPLTTVLTNVLDDEDFKSLRVNRHALVHRHNPPRHHRKWGDEGTSWGDKNDLGVTMIAESKTKFVKLYTDILEAAKLFVKRFEAAL